MAKKSKNESTLYYFYSQGCAYCKQVEPIVDKLNEGDYDILKLDLVEPDNAGLKREIENKYDLRCGTPWLVDASSGKQICGYRDEAVIKLWADGKDVPETPKPKTPAPRFPVNDLDNEEKLDEWREKFKVWAKENDHLENVANPEQIVENWRLLHEVIDTTFKGERLKRIKELHEHFEDRMQIAPASATKWFHNAFPGGYTAHVLNVIRWSLEYWKLFERMHQCSQ